MSKEFFIKRNTSGSMILNADQEAFGNIQCSDRKRQPVKAYCTSELCAGRGPRVKQVLKKVPATAYECPDCKHILFWE